MFYHTLYEHLLYISLNLHRNGSDKCDGCQKSESSHSKSSKNNEWDYKTCTVLEPTDAYSDAKRHLKFSSYKSKTAKVKFIVKYTNSNVLKLIFDGSKSSSELKMKQNQVI